MAYGAGPVRPNAARCLTSKQTYTKLAGMALTTTEAQTLAVLREFIDRHGYPPTVRELTEALGYRSPHTGQRRIRALAEAGVVTFQEGQPRTIRILDNQEAQT